jgi:hypothetical protein
MTHGVLLIVETQVLKWPRETEKGLDFESLSQPLPLVTMYLWPRIDKVSKRC